MPTSRQISKAMFLGQRFQEAGCPRCLFSFESTAYTQSHSEGLHVQSILFVTANYPHIENSILMEEIRVVAGAIAAVCYSKMFRMMGGVQLITGTGQKVYIMDLWYRIVSGDTPRGIP